jgi:hypothetical protein
LFESGAPRRRFSLDATMKLNRRPRSCGDG